jgi:hypothetical protein
MQNSTSPCQWDSDHPTETRSHRKNQYKANYTIEEIINSLTAIRVPVGTKTPALLDSYGRNSTESTVPHQHNNPQTSPPWGSHLPLLRCEIDGSAQSDAGNLFQRGLS